MLEKGRDTSNFETEGRKSELVKEHFQGKNNLERFMT